MRKYWRQMLMSLTCALGSEVGHVGTFLLRTIWAYLLVPGLCLSEHCGKQYEASLRGKRSCEQQLGLFSAIGLS